MATENQPPFSTQRRMKPCEPQMGEQGIYREWHTNGRETGSLATGDVIDSNPRISAFIDAEALAKADHPR
jgi:hypothetical protein